MPVSSQCGARPRPRSSAGRARAPRGRHRDRAPGRAASRWAVLPARRSARRARPVPRGARRRAPRRRRRAMGRARAPAHRRRARLRRPVLDPGQRPPRRGRRRRCTASPAARPASSALRRRRWSWASTSPPATSWTRAHAVAVVESMKLETALRGPGQRAGSPRSSSTRNTQVEGGTRLVRIEPDRRRHRPMLRRGPRHPPGAGDAGGRDADDAGPIWSLPLVLGFDVDDAEARAPSPGARGHPADDPWCSRRVDPATSSPTSALAHRRRRRRSRHRRRRAPATRRSTSTPTCARATPNAEGLPESFRDRLRRALAHYGRRPSLDPTPSTRTRCCVSSIAPATGVRRSFPTWSALLEGLAPSPDCVRRCDRRDRVDPAAPPAVGEPARGRPVPPRSTGPLIDHDQRLIVSDDDAVRPRRLLASTTLPRRSTISLRALCPLSRSWPRRACSPAPSARPLLEVLTRGYYKIRHSSRSRDRTGRSADVPQPSTSTTIAPFTSSRSGRWRTACRRGDSRGRIGRRQSVTAPTPSPSIVYLRVRGRRARPTPTRPRLHEPLAPGRSPGRGEAGRRDPVTRRRRASSC